MVCKKCSKEFTEKYSKWSNGDFCSKECAVKYSQSHCKYETKIVHCIDCGKELEVDKRASAKQCKCNNCRKQRRKYERQYNKTHKCLYCSTLIHAKKFCNSRCQADYRYKKQIENWLTNGVSIEFTYNNVPPYIRRYLFEKYDSKCTKCGWGEKNPVTQKIPLEVEHKDGNYKNNKEENLDLLCPNCHSLTPTYKALNKGYGRHFRNKRRKEGKSY